MDWLEPQSYEKFGKFYFEKKKEIQFKVVSKLNRPQKSEHRKRLGWLIK
jgi:hypothetical protein